MTNLFAATSVEEPVPAGHLPKVIQSYQDQTFTGVVDIGNIGGGYLDFLFYRGQIISVYARNPAGLIPISPESWFQVFPLQARSRHVVGSLGFSYRAVHMVRIRLAQSMQGKHFTNLPTSSLAENLGLSGDRLEPALIHLQWPSADALVFFPGYKRMAEQIAVFVDGQELPDKSSTNDLITWAEPEYSVTILGSASVDAWNFFALRHTFACLLENLLKRFGEVTGRVLVNSVVRSLNVACASKNLDINIINGKVVDQTIFVHLPEAAASYSELVLSILQQMSALVGKNVVLLIVGDILAEMDDLCLQTIKGYTLIPVQYIQLPLSGVLHDYPKT